MTENERCAVCGFTKADLLHGTGELRGEHGTIIQHPYVSTSSGTPEPRVCSTDPRRHGWQAGISCGKCGHVRYNHVEEEGVLYCRMCSEVPAAVTEADAPAHTDTPSVPEIVPMELWCPRCRAPHVDYGEWETRPHHTHLCRHCEQEFRIEGPYTRGIAAPATSPATEGERDRTWLWKRDAAEPERLNVGELNSVVRALREETYRLRLKLQDAASPDLQAIAEEIASLIATGTARQVWRVKRDEVRAILARHFSGSEKAAQRSDDPTCNVVDPRRPHVRCRLVHGHADGHANGTITWGTTKEPTP